MQRALCVYLPMWPLQRLSHGRPELRDKPVVLVQSGAARGRRVVLASAQASASGIRAGMPLAEALSIASHLCVEEEDIDQDGQSLKELAQWAERYSPLVGLEEGPQPQSLLLDISGCGACFRGEDRLLQCAMRDLAQEGWSARLAVADTLGAAWGLAHFGRTPLLVPPGQTEKFLASLPGAALRLPDDTLDLFVRLGIERIGQLIALPRPSLAPRFGPMLLQRLDQALGRAPEILTPHRWLPQIQTSCPFDPPTDRRQALHQALDHLTQRLHEVLRSRHWGARQIDCWLHFETAAPLRVEVNLFRPCHAFAYLHMLLLAQLDRVAITEPVCGLRLHVARAEPLADTQAELFETEPARALEGLSTLIDRLSSRLGRESVTRPILVADAQPEYACRFEPLIDSGCGTVSRPSCGTVSRPCHRPRPKVSRVRGDLRSAGWRGQETTPQQNQETMPQQNQETTPQQRSRRTKSKRQKVVEPAPSLRPLRLWSKPIRVQAMSVVPEGPPIQFRWNGMNHRIRRAWGPERIETGWWRHEDVHRDYYVVVTHVGNRFWLFRRHDDGRWFLHGCFD